MALLHNPITTKLSLKGMDSNHYPMSERTNGQQQKTLRIHAIDINYGGGNARSNIQKPVPPDENIPN